MEKKKKQKKKPRRIVEVQIDNEEEMRPPVIDLRVPVNGEYQHGRRTQKKQGRREKEHS